MPVVELEAPPEYVIHKGKRYRVGGFLVYRGLKLAGSGRDVPDANKIAELLGITEPLIMPVRRGDEKEVYSTVA